MIPAQAHLDPRFKGFPNLPEDQYESILAVPILARKKLAGALNVRTIAPREFTQDEIDLLLAIADQVAQTIEHAKLYTDAQRRVAELEALARISEAVSESLYLEESLEAIVTTTVDAVGATGAALVLEDGKIAWPEGRAAGHAVRLPLRWKGRQIGELVCDRDTPFSDQERALLSSIAHHAAVALEHARAVMRGVLAQEIHHRVKNNLQTVASLLRLQARSGDSVDPRKALDDSANRILAIAAVHEVLTETRHDDVELAELLDRLRAMLVQRLGSRPSSSRSPWRETRRPRSHWSSASFSRTRSSTAARRSPCSWRDETAESSSRSRTTGSAWKASRRARASRSSVRLCATSCVARSPCSRTAGFASRSRSRRENPDRRGRDDHQARPPNAARGGRPRGLCGGTRRCGGDPARPGTRARPRDPRRQDAPPRRHRGGQADPRRASDPDRDADGVRPGRAGRARRRGRRLRLPRQTVPRERPAARDRNRPRPPRGALGASR